MTDHRFAEALAVARAGREDGLGALLGEERDGVRREAQRLLPSGLAGAVGASDLVQETFVRARRYLPTFKGQTHDQWRAWLRAILWNRVQTRTQAAARERARVSSLDQDGHPCRADPTD